MNGLSSGMLKSHAEKLCAIVAVAMMMCTVLCVIDVTEYSVAERTNSGEPILITSETTVEELEGRFGKGTVDFTYDEDNKTGILTLKEGADFTCDLGEAEGTMEAVYAIGMIFAVDLDNCDAKITVKGSQASTLSEAYSITGLKSDGPMEINGNGTLTVDMSGFSGSLAEVIGVGTSTGSDIEIGKGAKLVCNGLSGDETTANSWKGIDCNGLSVQNAEVKVISPNADVVTGINIATGEFNITSAKMTITNNKAMISNGVYTEGRFYLENAELNITLDDVTKEAKGVTGDSAKNSDLIVNTSTLAINGEKVVTGIFYGTYEMKATEIRDSIATVIGNKDNKSSYGLLNGVQGMNVIGSNVNVAVGLYAIHENGSGHTLKCWECNVWGDGTKLEDPGSHEYSTENCKIVKTEPSDGKNYFNIKFDVGESGDATPVLAPSKGDKEITIPSATKTGAVLIKWTDGKSNTDYQPGDAVTFTEEVTLTAVWGHTVEYDPDGGSPTPKGETVEDGTVIKIGNAPTKDGYTFGGWSDGKKTYDTGAEYKVVWNTEFKAVWTGIAPILTVTSPTTGSTVDTETVDVTGTTDASSVSIKVNGTDAGTVSIQSGSFSKSVTLKEGENTIEITATGSTGGVTTKTVTITYESGSGPEPVPSGGSSFDGNVALLVLFVLAILAIVAIAVKKE